MDSKIRLFGHPAHQTLVAFPLGLLAGAVLFDVLGLLGPWSEGGRLAYGLLSAGLVAALVVAPLGLIDLVAVSSSTRAARTSTPAVRSTGRWLRRLSLPLTPRAPKP